MRSNFGHGYLHLPRKSEEKSPYPDQIAFQGQLQQAVSQSQDAAAAVIEGWVTYRR